MKKIDNGLISTYLHENLNIGEFSIDEINNQLQNILKGEPTKYIGKNIDKQILNPLENDKEGIYYDFTGFIDKDWIKNNLPLNGDFFLYTACIYENFS